MDKSFIKALAHWEREAQKNRIKMQCTTDAGQRLALLEQRRHITNEIAGIKEFMRFLGMNSRGIETR